MYSSMNLQAMVTGVISKYIQNISLKVFEEVLVFSLFLKKKERKKERTEERKNSILIANHKERGLVSLEG